MTVLYKAIALLRPGQNFGIGNEDDWDTIQMGDGSARPTDAEIKGVLDQAKQEQAMALLREKRDALLAETDFRSLPDYPGADKAAWLSYRQALRDLPATAQPTVNELGELTNVVFPSKPE